MQATQNQIVTAEPVSPVAVGWPVLASQWLPSWLDSCGFGPLATELRSCPAARLRRIVDRLFVNMQDELMAAMDEHIPLSDELCEPIAVTVAAEYIQASLPDPWLALVREGATAGRVALVAQMALFVRLLAMAADPDPADPLRLAQACARAAGLLPANQPPPAGIDLR